MDNYGWCKTERKFIEWLRSQLRNSFWKKHPVRLEIMKAGRKRMLNKKSGRMSYHHQCNKCKQWKPESEIEVNHIETVGTLTLDNVAEHVARLAIVDTKKLEKCCKDCHSIITYSERSGMSIEDSTIEKKIIAFFKKYDAKEQKRRFELAGLEPAKTVALRRVQLREYLRGKQSSAESTTQRVAVVSPETSRGKIRVVRNDQSKG